MTMVELVTAVGVTGIVSLVVATQMTDMNRSVANLTTRGELVSLRSVLTARVSCDASLAAYAGAGCPVGVLTPIILRDHKNLPIATTPGTGAFAGSNLLGDNWYIKAACDPAHHTVVVRIAKRNAAGGFAVDPQDPGHRYDFDAPGDATSQSGGTAATIAKSVHNPFFGVAPNTQAVPLCSARVDPTTGNPGVTPVNKTTCPTGSVITGVSAAGAVACSPKGSGITCPTGTVVRSISATGVPTCRAPLANVSCGGNGNVVVGLNTAGTPSCGLPMKNAACPAGKISKGNNPDGSPKCDDPLVDSTCPAGTVADGNYPNGAVKCSYPLVDSTCPAGQIQNGNNANGSPKCRIAKPTNLCGGGTVQVGTNWDGSPACTYPVPDSGCGSGQIVVGMWANGAPKCGWVAKYQDCGAGRMMRGLDSWGNAICDESWSKAGMQVEYSQSRPGVWGGAISVNPYTGNQYCPAAYHPLYIFGLDRQCQAGNNGGENWCNAWSPGNTGWLNGEYFHLEAQMCVR